jgi:predicted nucleotidyltransferase
MGLSEQMKNITIIRVKTFICQNNRLENMSHPEIIENCKKIILKYLLDAIGATNIVSIILYGSVARNEESYKYVKGKLYLESDIDVIVVVKDRILVVKSWLLSKDLCNIISRELRKNWLLSHVNLSTTTQKRLLYASPNAFDLHLKLNGKVIFGKELIEMMPSYENVDIPVPSLCNMIFCHMMALVRILATSGIIDGKIDVNVYDSILRSIKKLTLFMVRAIILKERIPMNPYNLAEIRTKKDSYEIKKPAIFDDLLYIYDDIKSSEQGGNISIAEICRYLDKVIILFDSTVAILTGISYPFAKLPEELIFGRVPFSKKLAYGFQNGSYLLLTNFRTGWSIGLFRYIIANTFRYEVTILRFYDLFISSSSMIQSLSNQGITNNQQRQTWLKIYKNTLKPWKYSTVPGT